MKRLLSVLLVLLLPAILLCCPLTISASDDPLADMNAIIKDYGKATSVVVYSMDGTTLYTYQANKIFSGASLIKLPYCYYACAQIENGVRSADETVTYTEDWYHGGSGIIRHGEYNVDYTLEQLIDYALRYSDNVAYDMLVDRFGITGFNNMISSWGYTVKIGQTYPRFPGLNAAFMQECMRRMYIRSDDGGMWGVAWNALCESEATYVRGIVGDDITPVAVKYGNVATVWHEVCYIGSDYPYILIIMSSATDYDPDISYLEAVAACAERINNQHIVSLGGKPRVLVRSNDPTPYDLSPLTDALPALGDVNADGSINAADATCILQAAANIGAFSESGLNADQLLAADLDLDSLVNAADAVELLRYAAYRGAGGTDPLEDFLRPAEIPTETEAPTEEETAPAPEPEPQDPAESEPEPTDAAEPITETDPPADTESSAAA